MTATRAPGDFVMILARRAPYALGMIREAFDCGPDGLMFDVTVPGEAPVPVLADEIRAATDEDKAAHHPTWVRFLVEDWRWRQAPREHAWGWVGRAPYGDLYRCSRPDCKADPEDDPDSPCTGYDPADD